LGDAAIRMETPSKRAAAVKNFLKRVTFKNLWRKAGSSGNRII
jgi:hypothetical protein